jgi:putative ABC transport system permease protein
MLKLKKIRKVYQTGGGTQTALDGVSLTLRDNEFVAILGPSGSGKTTLLNVIGGLDRYDSGELLINHVSTKTYKDRDWDSYRNHTVGFVFQSYNLIMHQSVLANVELALTISGIPASERKRRAEDALKKVGLAEHMHKRPTQLSGGQMQRVAIARALVNDPDILLADEPTGALDSDTSVQVMDLLKEVARERLVVMVTHNPELAKQYATRIVRIRDGQIESDTDPVPEIQDQRAPEHHSFGRASMSFLTALSLSFHNLRTKKARTLLVSFAGSIGIIGIALILAISAGVSTYIATQENETLSQYPIEIYRTGTDLSGLISSRQQEALPGAKEETYVDRVGVQDFVDSLFSGVKTNDLRALKKWMESDESGMKQEASSIEYTYDITPQIYHMDDEGEIIQINPNELFSSLNLKAGDLGTMLSGAVTRDVFQKLPSDKKLFEDAYEVKAGHWPENDHELVLVLDANGMVGDLLLYDLGIRDPKLLKEKAEAAASDPEEDADGSDAADESSGNESVSRSESAAVSSSPETDEDGLPKSYTYDELLGRKLKLVRAQDYYIYNSEYDVWTDRSGDSDFIRQLVENGEDLTIAGIVQPRKKNGGALSEGLYYTDSLIANLMDEAKESEVVKAQQYNPERNVLTGQKFGEEQSEENTDLSKLFQIDEQALKEAFQINDKALDPSALSDSFSKNLSSALSGGLSDALKGADASKTAGSLIDPEAIVSSLPPDTLTALLRQVKLNVTAQGLIDLFQSVAGDFLAYAEEQPQTDYSILGESIRSYLGSEEARTLIQSLLSDLVRESIATSINEDTVSAAVEIVLEAWIAQAETSEGQSEVYDLQAFREFLGSDQGRAALAEARAQLGIDKISITEEQIRELQEKLSEGYNSWAEENGKPRTDRFAETFRNYLNTDRASALLTQAASMVDTDSLRSAVSGQLEAVTGAAADSIASQLSGLQSQITEAITKMLTEGMQNAVGSMAGDGVSGLSDLFSVNPDALAGAIQTNLDAGQLRDLLSSMYGGSEDTLESNYAKMGYADPDDPESIRIYASSFQSKQKLTDLLDEYNQKLTDEGRESETIAYTDLVSAMLSSVMRIINMVSAVLIAFVAISLVVSSIMIGVITYISVLERRREIGILRAMGASKRNIRQVFNAETFITGLLAGVIGVFVSVLLTMPVRSLITHFTDEIVLVRLPVPAAFALILLSIFLTLIAGLLPASKAAGSDPVAALRSE